MINCEFIKYVAKNHCFSINLDIKMSGKTMFFDHIFEKFIMSYEFGLYQDFEDLESMTRWFSISNILTISSLLASGGRKNFISPATDRSWNNHLHIEKIYVARVLLGARRYNILS